MILIQLFFTFLKVGAFAFGGGYAMLSLIGDSVLAYGWMTEEELLNFVGVETVIPGPIAVNMATYIGYEQGGFPGALLAASVLASLLLCMTVDVDYGFFGILLPVFTSFFEDRPRRLVMFTATLLALSIDLTAGGFIYQFWCLLAVPLLAVYNGKPGKYRMKYFFYIFYPAHLVFLYALDMLF